MNKKLNTTAVINELKGESAFFRAPVSQPMKNEEGVSRKSVASSVPKRISPPPPAIYDTRRVSVSERPDERSIARTDGRVSGRETVRHAFEFYQDQIYNLKEMRRKALIKGQGFSMSEIVRTALDQYLAKLEASDHPSDRPVDRTAD